MPDDVAHKLRDVLRELAAIQGEIGIRLAEHTNVSLLPMRQSYVAEYLDSAGQLRIAIVRSVTWHADNSLSFFTGHGTVLVLLPAPIKGWEPIVQRENEPLPDG